MADLEAQVRALAERVTKTEGRLDDHDDRLNEIDKKQAAQGATLTAVDRNAEKAANGVDQIKWGLFLLAVGMALQLLYMILGKAVH